MAALPYMQLYVADYLADTAHLTTEEHGAYLLLLFSYWQTGKPLRADRLASVARLSSERWADVERTLKDFFHVRGGTWTHFRVEADLEKVSSKSKKNSEAGKASARARAIGKQGLEDDKPTDVGTNVQRAHQRNVNHTDTDTDTDTDAEAKGLAKTTPKKPRAKTENQLASSATWEAYATAYFNRYGTEPVRNAKINGQIAQIIQRLGAEVAPHVAAYFVSAMNKAFYVSNLHPVGVLLKDCEAIHTQWATNRQVTDTKARQIDQSQTNASTADDAYALYLEMERNGVINAQ